MCPCWVTDTIFISCPAPKSHSLSALCFTPKTSSDSVSKVDNKLAPKEGISWSLVLFQISSFSMSFVSDMKTLYTAKASALRWHLKVQSAQKALGAP